MIFTKEKFFTTVLVRFIFITFVFSIVFILIRIIMAPAVAPSTEALVRVKSDYVFMLVQSLLGVAAMMLPGFLKHRINLEIPSFMVGLYVIFLYFAVYLGEIRNFHLFVPYWDTVLYAFTGVAMGALAFSVVSLLNKPQSAAFSLSPVFVALFSFCFSLSLGVMREIFGFILDYFFRSGMRQYGLVSGELLPGRTAQSHAIKNLIVTSIGAFVMAAIGFTSLKFRKGWIEKILIRAKHEDFISVLERLDRTSLETADALSDAIDARDEYTAGHSHRVMQYSELIGRHLDLSAEALEQLKISALLHDVGKLGIPDNILHKHSQPTEDEYAIIRTHPDIGAKILNNIESFRDIVPAVHQHHEWFDGSGYPNKVKGEAIALHARIIAVADSFDAMTSSRAYRDALSAEEALDEIRQNRESQFDPLLADIFINTMGNEVHV